MLACSTAAGEQAYMRCALKGREGERGGKVRERARGFVKIKAQITALLHSYYLETY
jgi:hypothetical protein